MTAENAAAAPATAPDATPPSLPPVSERQQDAKIPGLELTWRDAEILELADSTIATLLDLKRQYYKVILIPTQNDLYVARSCSRQEWRQVVTDLGNVDETRDRLIKEGKPENVVNQHLTMISEDKLVERFLIYPKLQLTEIRQLPPGEVKTIHDAIMVGLGYGQQPRAIRL